MAFKKLLAYRRILFSAIAVSITVVILVFFAPSVPRRAAIWLFAVYYDNISSFEVSSPNLGPIPPDESSQSETTIVDGMSITFSGPRPSWDFPFAHEDLESKEAREFSRQVKRLVSQSGDPLTWSQDLRSLAPHDATSLAPDISRGQLLEQAARGEPLTCYYFAHLLQATSVVHGYTSRVLGLSSTGERFEHAVVEVYVPERRKWVLIDCDFNVAYCNSAGELLNAKELQQYWRKAKSNAPFDRTTRRQLPGALGLSVVVLGEAGARLRKSNMLNVHTGLNLRLFEWVLYDCRNNFLSGEYPFGHPDAVRQLFLGPSLVAPPIAPEANSGEGLDLYPHVGAVGVALSALGTLQIGTVTPNFKRFEMRRNGGMWRSLDSENLVLDRTTQGLEIRSINKAGIRGPIRVIEIASHATDSQ